MNLFDLINAKIFKGTMKFPLTGSHTYEHFQATTEFTGDFKDPKKRHTIFKQKRLYKFTVVLKHINGTDVDEVEYEFPNQPLDKNELTQLMKQLSKEQIQEANPDLVDLTSSYLLIELV